MDDQTLFKDEEVFTPGYMPDDIQHRDDQIKEISLSLKPGLRGVNPENTLIHGPPGTGKTTIVKHVFEELAEVTGQLIPVYVNCEDSNTRFAVFSRIHEKVLGTSPPDTGKPLDSVKEKIFRKLTQEDKSLVVALDELDQLFIKKNIDKVLLDLLKAHTTYGYDRVGVLGIMIDEKYMAELTAKTRSVYNPQRTYFTPYTQTQVYDILANRVKHGLYSNTLPEKTLEDIVDKTLTSGDMRVGIDLIRRSTRLAERDSSKKITGKHIAEAYDTESRLINLKNTLTALGGDEERVLGVLADSGEENSGRLYEAVQKDTGMGVKRYNEIIAKLEHLKVVDTSYTLGAKGRSRNILLRYEPAEVRRNLKK